MSRNRVQRSTPRRGLLGAAAFAVLVAGLVGTAGAADAAPGPSSVSFSCSAQAGDQHGAQSSARFSCTGGPSESLGVRWQ